MLPTTSDRSATSQTLTNGRLLARNMIWNLVGQGVPVIAAFFAIPLLVNGLGIARFGILTLVWASIGYFSLFDLGLGRALTKLVAEKLGQGREHETLTLIWTSLLIMTLLGAAGAALVAVLAPWLVRSALNIPEALRLETVYAFTLLAVSLPLVTSTSGLRGILEAQQRFGPLNVIRTAMGLFTFLGPVLVLPFSRSNVPIVAVLLMGRLITWLVHLLLCLQVMPALRRRIALQRSAVGSLLRFGSWMTVTNVVGPLLSYLDRFLIGALLSVGAVTYYVTPYELVTKLVLIPAAISGVLFPAFATSFAQNRSHMRLIFSLSMKGVIAVLAPLILAIVLLAREGLTLWLGAEFAQNSTYVLQWLAIGAFVTSLSQIPFALVLGAGRPDFTAKLHLIQLPLYLLANWWLIRAYGIGGAAIAGTVRAAVDTVFLFGMTQRVLLDSAPLMRRLGWVVGGVVLAMVCAILPAGIGVRASFLALALIAFGPIAWYIILIAEERTLMRNSVNAIRTAMLHAR